LFRKFHFVLLSPFHYIFVKYLCPDIKFI